MARGLTTVSPARSGVFLSCAALVALAVVAYHNSLSGPFVFDDVTSIPENASIRRLGTALFPPGGGETVTGRPLLNLSFALNYAWGGNAVRGYHLTNVAIHLAAALALFGLVRRTLLLPRLREAYGRVATGLALAIAALWLVHPLQTESVTYIVQRAESLMGLFFLLTFYAFARAAHYHPLDDNRAHLARAPQVGCHLMDDNGSRSARREWGGLSIAACALGMATKEVMVTAPVLVLFYDRAFVAGSFADAWRVRKRYYLGLAATWLVLAALVIGTGGNRGGSSGSFGHEGTFFRHLLAETESLATYLKLSLWPHPLVFEYEPAWPAFPAIVPAVLLALALIGATLVALRRAPAGGFLGAWFFGVLAPTLLVPTLTQFTVEHRMYLSLAALLALLVLGAHRRLGRGTWPITAAAVVLFTWLTIQRNADYRTAAALWSDTARKHPQNPLAHFSLGDALRNDDPARAIAEYEEALRLQPRFPIVNNNLGSLLLLHGRVPEALAQLEQAMALDPKNPEAHNNAGLALASLGRLDEAIARFEAALRLQPAHAEAENNLGNAHAQLQRWTEALAHFQAAARLNPEHRQAFFNVGSVSLHLGRHDEARVALERAVAITPRDPEAQALLGRTLELSGRANEAVARYEEALRLQPGQALAAERMRALRGSR